MVRSQCTVCAQATLPTKFILSLQEDVMQPVLIVFVLMLSMSVLSLQSKIQTLDDIPALYPVKSELRKRWKRQVASSAIAKKPINFASFLEDSLVQHGKALEQMLRSVQKSENITKSLIETFIRKYVIEPPATEKINHEKQTNYQKQIIYEKTKRTHGSAPVLIGKKIPANRTVHLQTNKTEVQIEQKKE